MLENVCVKWSNKISSLKCTNNSIYLCISELACLLALPLCADGVTLLELGVWSQSNPLTVWDSQVALICQSVFSEPHIASTELVLISYGTSSQTHHGTKKSQMACKY